MSTFSSPLENIKVASPCSADWDAMIGDERTRFCGSCKLNVFNLSGMTRTEAESLIINAEGRLCVRFYRRADGTVLTKDCPVGWSAFKRRVSKTATAVVSLLFGILSGLGFSAYFSGREEEDVMGKISAEETISVATTGIALNSSEVMGNVSAGRIATKGEMIVGEKLPMQFNGRTRSRR